MAKTNQYQLDANELNDQFRDIIHMVKQLKKPIYNDLQKHPSEFHAIEHAFPVKQCEDIFNAICIITDQERLNRYLMTKRTNQWSMVVYLLVNPLLSYIITQLVVSFIFDFIKKAMIVSGQTLPIPINGTYGHVCGMFLNSHMSTYTEEYVRNALKYYTCYNGYNCTIDGAIGNLKQINWSIVNYAFNQVCFKLYRTAINPSSSYQYVSITLLLCIMLVIISMIQKIKIE